VSNLDPRAVRAWARLAAGALGRDRGVLNSANVFPVPDADTGTNLYLTARAGAQAVAEMPPDATAAQLLAALARGALVGARGNSGTILAEWYRGLAMAVAQGQDLPAALDRAAQVARQAVAKPAPGTILTAADAAAQASAAVREPADSARIAAAVAGARSAAVASPTQLPQLAKAGTLDAGACGLVLVLDALRAATAPSDGLDLKHGGAGEAQTGLYQTEPVTIGLDLASQPSPTQMSAANVTGPLADYSEHGGLDDDEFEVMFTLWRPTTAAGFAPGQLAQQLRADLAEVGGSVVVVGGAVDDSPAPGGTETVWQAHVHVRKLTAVRDLLLGWARRGRIDQIQVRYLAVPNSDLTVFATATTPQLADEFARGGAVVLANERIGAGLQPGADSALSVEALARAAVGSATPAVLVLAPGDAAFAAQVHRRVAELLAAAQASGALDAETLPTVQVLATPTDAATATALGTLAETDGEDPAARVRSAGQLLDHTAVLRADSPTDLAAFPAAAPPDAVVTALVDADIATTIVDQLASRYGDQLVLLQTGRPGTRVELAITDAS